MEFIYELSYSGVPFYIGRAKSPIARFSMHINATTSQVNNFVSCNKFFGIYPEINILYHSKSISEIRKKENEFVKCYSKLGIKLLNIQLNAKNTFELLPTHERVFNESVEMPYYVFKKVYFNVKKYQLLYMPGYNKKIL